MAKIHEEGGFASYVGRPLGVVSVPPSYSISFFNKTLLEELEILNISNDSSQWEYREDLVLSKPYSRILHFSIMDASTGKVILDPKYLPYIDTVTYEDPKTIYNIKPLAEVVYPTFVKINDGEFIMYFFSSFDYDIETGSPVEDDYSDDAEILRRVVEFATNEASQIEYGDTESYGISSTGNAPVRNNRNLFTPELLEDVDPRMALLSCVLKIGTSKVDGYERVFVWGERPRFVTFVGQRFNLDFHAPLLVNTIQNLRWSANKAGSNDLDEEIITEEPVREVPYHHLISGIETKMYPGYAGINFKTKPINELYGKTLDHIFRHNGTFKKSFNTNGLFDLRSISVSQLDCSNISFPSFECFCDNGSSSSASVISSSEYEFLRHFAIFDINTDENVTPASGTCVDENFSPDDFDSYSVDIPNTINPKGEDKPSFWKNYWSTCGNEEDGDPPVGGSIEIIKTNDYTWKGQDCIDGVNMYAVLTAHPYFSYKGSFVRRIDLEIGLVAKVGGEFDVVWSGSKMYGVEPIGMYSKTYALGDDTPLDIEIL
jgi:hypothetical protein